MAKEKKEYKIYYGVRKGVHDTRWFLIGHIFSTSIESARARARKYMPGKDFYRAAIVYT